MIILILFSINSAYSDIDSLEKVIARSEGRDKVDAYLELSDQLMSREPERGIRKAEEALDIAYRLSYIEGQALSAKYLGWGNYLLGNFEKAIESFETSYLLFGKTEDRKQQSAVLNNMGICYRYLGNYKDALIKYEQSLDIKYELKDSSAIAKSLNNIGLVYYNIGSIDKALEYFNRSLEIKKADKDQMGLAKSYNNIGLIYQENDKIDLALQNYQRSYEILENSGNEKDKAKALSNLGTAYFALRDFKRSMEYHKKAIEIKKEISDKNGIAFSYSSIADIYKEQSRFDESENMYYSALKIFEEINSSSGKATILYKLGKLKAKEGKSNRARKLFSSSHAISQNINNLRLLRDNSYELYLIDQKKGDFKSALENFEEYELLKDSLAGNEAKRKVTELEIRHQTDLKNKEIDFLKQQNEQQSELNNSLYMILLLFTLIIIMLIIFYLNYRASNRKLIRKNQELDKALVKLNELNATKDRFFAIISHDLKNPLGVFVNLTEMMKDNIDDFSPDESREYLIDMYHSSVQVLDLLEKLLLWSKTQSGRIDFNPEEFNIHDVAANVIYNLQMQAKEKEISIENSISKEAKIYADMNMISTILRNLISNAIKFTKPNGDIKLELKEYKEDHIISVKDNGIGMTDNAIENLFSIDKQSRTKGTKGETGTGLGLMISREFVEKHNGQIWVESKVGKGTQFFISIPKKAKIF